MFIYDHQMFNISAYPLLYKVNSLEINSSILIFSMMQIFELLKGRGNFQNSKSIKSNCDIRSFGFKYVLPD